MTWLLALMLLAVPETFDSVAKNAEAARDRNQLDEAVRLYKRALQMNPKWAEGWFYMGTIYYDRDQNRDAVGAFQKSSVYAPKNPVTWAFLGLSEFNAGDYPNSLKHLLHARELGVGMGDQVGHSIRYHIGILQTKFEQFEAATDTFGEFARRGEDSPQVLEATGIAALRMPILPAELAVDKKPLALQVGRAMFEVGMRKEAESRARFEQIVAQYPDVPNVHYLYGTFLLRAPGDAGIEELKKEIALSPQHVPARLQIAFEYLKRSDFSNGLPFAEQAAQIEPENFIAWNALGRLQMGLERHADAVKSLERAVKLAPDSPENHFALATAYSKVGRAQDAARERAEFVRLNKLRKKPEGE